MVHRGPWESTPGDRAMGVTASAFSTFCWTVLVQLSGACLDVFRTEPLPKEHPFRKHKNILITPHNSSATPAESVAPQILENYRRAVSGRQLLNTVDLEHGY